MAPATTDLSKVEREESASASSRSISATAPSEAWSMRPRVIERATARHATVLGERRRLRELGHQLGLTLVLPFRRLKAREMRHTGRFSGVRRSTFMQVARRVERDTAPAPPGARFACRACGRGNYAGFLQTAAACVTGVKVGASASGFHTTQGVRGAVRLLSALGSPTQCCCRGVLVVGRRGFRPWRRVMLADLQGAPRSGAGVGVSTRSRASTRVSTSVRRSEAQRMLS